MGLTGLIFVVIYFTGCALTFYNPVYGVMTYVFEWHNHPNYFWWGRALPDLRWSFLIAFLTMASWAMNKTRLKPMYKPSYAPVGWIFAMSFNMFLVTLFAAVLPGIGGPSWDKFLEIFKIGIFSYLMVQLVREYDNYRQLIWVVIACVAHFGWTAFTEGSNRDIGVVAPNATEENAISAHVVAILPFFGIYFLMTKNKWQKIFLVLSVPLCLNLLILANSRSALLGLVAIGLLSVVLTKGRHRAWVVVGLAIGAVAFLFLTNEQFWERQETTANYQDDGSAMSRIHIWTGGLEMWKDHPFGVGGGGFVHLSMDYIPEIKEPKSQHNTYVAVFTDWGFIGMILYFCYLIHIIMLTFKIKRNSKMHPLLMKYHLEVTALQMAIAGICAAGMFHSRQYAEVVYWLGSFTMILNNVQKTEMAEIQADMEAASEVSENGELQPSNQMISR